MSEPAARILMISGSGRDGSTNTAVLGTAAELAPDGVTAELFTGLLALPLFNPDEDRGDATPHPAIVAMRAAVAAADGRLTADGPRETIATAVTRLASYVRDPTRA